MQRKATTSLTGVQRNATQNCSFRKNYIKSKTKRSSLSNFSVSAPAKHFLKKSSHRTTDDYNITECQNKNPSLNTFESELHVKCK